MRNKIILLLFIVINSTFINAQSVDFFFQDMPKSVLPTLPYGYRLELLEYYKAEKRDTIKNAFGTKIKLLNWDTENDCLQLQMNSITRWEMMIIHKNDSTPIISIITTVCAPICSSYIDFYDKNWNKLSIKIPRLTALEFLKKSKPNIEHLIRANFIEFSFEPKTKSLLCYNRSLDFLGIEEKKEVEEYFTDKPKRINLLKIVQNFNDEL